MKIRSCLLSLLRLLLLTLLIVVGAGAPSANDFFRELTYQDYVFRLYDKTVMFEGRSLLLEQTLVVSKSGREVFRKVGHRWYISDKHPKIGTDITGTGHPNAVILEYSGGAHCCNGNHIFELGEPFKVIEVHSGDFPIRFKELDGRPGFEIVLLDTIFLYWNTDFASSPAPKVILRYDRGAYQFAADLMTAPAMSRKEILQRAKEIRNGARWGRDKDYPFDERLWKVMLDLIYTGNVEQAREFAELAWPPSFPGKKEFLFEFFDCHLRRSPYWPGVAALNDLPPKKPEKNCPLQG